MSKHIREIISVHWAASPTPFIAGESETFRPSNDIHEFDISVEYGAGHDMFFG